mgnify:CR=1 FL=1
MSMCFRCRAILNSERNKMSALCDRCIKIEEELENDDLAPDRDMSFLQKDGKVLLKFNEGWDDCYEQTQK